VEGGPVFAFGGKDRGKERNTSVLPIFGPRLENQGLQNMKQGSNKPTWSRGGGGHSDLFRPLIV